MSSCYDNERKIIPHAELSEKTVELLRYIMLHFRPIVLGVTYWNCFRPWHVPRRRICDNFMLFVEDGLLSVTVSGRHRILRRGECVFVPEFEPHAYGFADGCDSASHFIMHALCENIAITNPFRCFDSPFLALPASDWFLNELKGIVALRAHDERAAFAASGMLLRMFFATMARQGRWEMMEETYPDSRMAAALHFINTNFKNNIAMQDIADFIHLKEVRFRVLFRRQFGLSPSEYLMRTRLLHACRLLARYAMPLREVAADSGFFSESYFCTSFRRMFLMTPGEYRRMIASG